MTTIYREALEIMTTVNDLSSASSVLQWDQETYMPKAGVTARAEQIATLDTLAHEFLTNDKAKNAVANIRENFDSLAPDEQEILTVFLRDHDQAIKLSDELVRETSRAQSLGQNAWKQARTENNFALFASALQRLIDLKMQAADCYGYKENRYDALINLFEQDMTVAQLKPVFQRLREGTKSLLERVPKTVENEATERRFARQKQLDFGRSLVEKMGFDFTKGRMDLTAHPFCTKFSTNDVRLTTRVSESDLQMCLFSLIHEAGHGMYEQNIDEKYSRTAATGGTSMGIHESQSLFWEGILAREQTFWQWAYPQLHTTFADELGAKSAKDFYRDVNAIKPSLIRTESDGLTYNMHIILRFELEIALFNGELSVHDIPEAWNAKMEEYLGITPQSAANGCLQDIHWSFGGFGYFATYTLGRLYSAMLWKQLQKDMPNVHDSIANGIFAPIKEWLRVNVHQFGRTRNSEQIITAVCGRSLTETDFLDFYSAKITDIYG